MEYTLTLTDVELKILADYIDDILLQPGVEWPEMETIRGKINKVQQ